MYKANNKDLLHNPGNHIVINYNGKELIQRIYIYICCCLVAKSCLTLTLFDPMAYAPPGSFWPWDFPSKNIGVDCHFLLQGIFLYSRNRTYIFCIGRWVLYQWATWEIHICIFIIKSLCCIPETNKISQISYTSTRKDTNRGVMKKET